MSNEIKELFKNYGIEENTLLYKTVESQLEQAKKEIEDSKNAYDIMVIENTALVRQNVELKECHNDRADFIDDLQSQLDEVKKERENDMRYAFNESRLTHPMVGFKHDTFENYLKSLTPTKEERKEGRCGDPMVCVRGCSIKDGTCKNFIPNN